jgi:opacity protein-like surface antigen
MRRIGMAVLGLTLTAAPLWGQRSALREVRNRGSAGGGLMVAVPVGEFGNHISIAGGLDLFGALSLDRSGALSLRLDGSWLAYDHVRDAGYVSSPYYSIPVDLNTTSYIASLRAGPQLTLGQGALRLYGFGLGGVSYFATETSAGGCGCDSFGSITQYDDVTAAWEAGGGLQIKLGRGHTPVLLDLGARYLHNGRVTYLPARSLSGGATVLRPIESEANVMIYQLGVTVGLR